MAWGVIIIVNVLMYFYIFNPAEVTHRNKTALVAWTTEEYVVHL